jgi:prolycopene isomerase
VGKKMETLPDPAMVHYHLPDSLSVRVHREYEEFIAELTSKFPHEKEGIRKFYNDCWKVGRPKGASCPRVHGMCRCCKKSG